MGILDNAKDVANAVHEIKNIELYGRVLDLHAGIIDLVEENRKLRAENEDLKKTLELREKMTFNEPFYYQKDDKTPFCPACWEVKNSPIHLVFVFAREDAVRWDCKVCHNTFMDKKDRSVERTHRFEPPTSEWG
jgi:regulator of replication initiation timing